MKKDKDKEKGKENFVSDISKAGEHLLVSATEGILATGYALKGIKGLLNNGEGRKKLINTPNVIIKEGFNALNHFVDYMHSRREDNKKRARTNKKSRKIEVE